MAEHPPVTCDVAIIGGGPAGATAGTLLKKYNPDLRVIILEKERFPREHIGESQLPAIMPILDEMGVWEDVEAAGFPVKIGASYTWGRDSDRWNFDFVPVETWTDPPRPGKFEGQRTQTAFQVDRSVYDTILLRHAEKAGCDVREQTQVREIRHTARRVDGFTLDSGETITARYYIDASGAVSLMRRALDIPTWSPNELKNIAFWDYWQDADWAVEIGTTATRIQIRSLPYGWMWFIPVGPQRTSIGLVAPVEWYKQTGMSPQEIYRQAMTDQAEVAALTENATPEGKFQTCKDWSNLADDPVGENWFLVGESAGFADPILSAGMTLAHTSAREAAYSILEFDRGELEPDWVRDRYHTRIREGIRNHIRFAQYWYAANSCFTDLKDNCSAIAKEAGVKLSAEQAWRWLSLGGFTSENVGTASLGSFGVTHTRRLLEMFDTSGRKLQSLASGYNVFKLQLRAAERTTMGVLEDGRIRQVECYRRADRVLPLAGVFKVVCEMLEQTSDARTMAGMMSQQAGLMRAQPDHFAAACYEALDVMIQDGWVTRSKDKKRPALTLSHAQSRTIRSHQDEAAALERAADAPDVVDRLSPEG